MCGGIPRATRHPTFPISPQRHSLSVFTATISPTPGQRGGWHTLANGVGGTLWRTGWVAHFGGALTAGGWHTLVDGTRWRDISASQHRSRKEVQYRKTRQHGKLWAFCGALREMVAERWVARIGLDGWHALDDLPEFSDKRWPAVFPFGEFQRSVTRPRPLNRAPDATISNSFSSGQPGHQAVRQIPAARSARRTVAPRAVALPEI